jgi:cytoskeleton protein RodZ
MEMQEVGNELKALRQQKGLTLEQVEQDTKIRVRYLEAIEAGDLKVLPGTVYARGFIKSYADYLGMNGQQLLETHGLIPQVQQEQQESLRRTKKKVHVEKERNVLGASRLLPQIIGGVAVLGLLALGYQYLLKEEDAKETGKEGVQAQGTNVQQEVKQPAATEQATPAPQPEPQKPKTVVTEESKQANATVYAVTGAESLTLELAATDSCWVEVKADGQTVETGIIKPGETRTWKADKSLSILTGKSKFITLKVNEQVVTFEPQLRGYTYSFERKPSS